MKQKSIIFLLLLFHNWANAQSNINKNQKNRIDQVMQHYYNQNKFNGAILVANSGELVYKKAFGIANRKQQTALDTHTPFYLCSLSKQFTSLAITMLEEKGLIHYNDKLTDYFPEFPSYGKKITIHHLLTHTSGLYDYFNKGQYRKNLTNKQVLNFLLRQSKTNFPPGSKYSYSNSGYVLLSILVERITNTPFHVFLKEHIFKPLHMKNTLVYDESKPKISKRAIGYNANGKLNDYKILTTGDGGIYSSIEDLFLWDKALYSNKLVSNKTIKKLYKPNKFLKGETMKYGYGWFFNVKSNIAFHGGSLAGYKTYIERDLKNKRTIIILSNFNCIEAINEMPNLIRNILSNKKYKPRFLH